MITTLLDDLRRLQRQQWADQDDLDRVVFAKLKRQVHRAWEHSPFYHDRFESCGITPASIEALPDLMKLPIVRKTDLLAAGESAASADVNLDECVKLKTSGSSGRPFTLPFTKKDKAHRVLKELRALLANGYKPTDQMLILISPDDIPASGAAFQKLGLFRRTYISIFEEHEKQIQAIQTIRPQILYSYTSCLRLLAEKVLALRKKLPPPKMLMTAAELLDPNTRGLITEAFGTEPIDFYGSMEFGWIAWQCPQHKGYHINSDCLIVECLVDGRPAEPGEEGELVITNLHSDAVPLIRYASGDTGVPMSGVCECGRNLPMLSHIGGRLADCVMLPDGRKLSPYSVTCAVEGVPGVRQFQIVQETEESVRVRVVSVNHVVDEDVIRLRMHEALGMPVDVTVEYAESLLPEKNGKFKVVKSLVGSPIDGKQQQESQRIGS